VAWIFPARGGERKKHINALIVAVKTGRGAHGLKQPIIFFFIIPLIICGVAFPTYAAELQILTNARLVNNLGNDGDSFHVNIAGRLLHLRLYYVDCPEISAKSKSDARRIREQTRYFGLPDATRTVHFGHEAKAFIEKVLSKPFTIYTSYASALGRSAKSRVYGFIKTAVGGDLCSLLVKNGLARTYGPTLALRIIAGRPYKSVDELIKVKGIGRKKLEKFRPHFTVGN